MSVIKFARRIGMELTIKPYTSQADTPTAIKIKVPSEMSFVCFVLYTLTACGRKARVVQTAAK